MQSRTEASLSKFACPTCREIELTFTEQPRVPLKMTRPRLQVPSRFVSPLTRRDSASSQKERIKSVCSAARRLSAGRCLAEVSLLLAVVVGRAWADWYQATELALAR
jgi:hypothetical protein